MKITPVMPLGFATVHNNLTYGMSVPEPKRPFVEKTHYPCHYFDVCGNYADHTKLIKDEEGEWIEVYICPECEESIDDGLMNNWGQDYV